VHARTDVVLERVSRRAREVRSWLTIRRDTSGLPSRCPLAVCSLLSGPLLTQRYDGSSLAPPQTGREVPHDDVLDSIQRVPQSVATLCDLVGCDGSHSTKTPMAISVQCSLTAWHCVHCRSTSTCGSTTRSPTARRSSPNTATRTRATCRPRPPRPRRGGPRYGDASASSSSRRGPRRARARKAAARRARVEAGQPASSEHAHARKCPCRPVCEGGMRVLRNSAGTESPQCDRTQSAPTTARGAPETMRGGL
jgi:hypothetical protein